LPRHFVGVGVTFGQLLLDEFLNRLCHGNFHALKLAQVGKTDNAQIRRRPEQLVVKPERSNLEMLPLSLLNDFLYCNRRAALKVVEGWRSANQHTARGDIVHEHADLRGYEIAKGVKTLRALPVFSDRLGLNGKCDLVEVHPHPASGHPLPADGRGAGGEGTLFPVEFKVGKRRQWENDDAQLCAQALCLEEMFQTIIPRGAVFHADSKRRREIEFTPALRALTEKTIADLHALLDSAAIPRAVFREACEECSLYEICLPKATGADSRAAQLADQLFKT
jgi:CRISPR-associated exonuclease Cas4